MNLRLTPIVLRLLIANVLVFLVQMAFSSELWVREYFWLWKIDLIFPRFEPAPEDGFFSFLPIQLITSFFSHAGITHILFNMYALVSFGTLVEYVMGARKFLTFYLFCGVFGTTVTALFDPSPMPVLGASGALFGVMVAFAYYFPNQRMGIMFLPFQFKVRPFIIVICAISAMLVIADAVGMRIGGGISHFGHLAGAAGAAVLLFGNQIPRWFRRRDQ